MNPEPAVYSTRIKLGEIEFLQFKGLLLLANDHLRSEAKMRSRIQLLRSGRPIAVRPRVTGVSAHQTPLCLRLQQRRNITAAEKPLPESEQPEGPNQDQLQHVSEEAAETGKIMGEGGPELERGSPVQEVKLRALTNTILIS